MTRPLQHRTVHILQLDGRPWASAGFTGGLPSDAWAWVQEVVATECGADPETVSVAESDEGDLITVEGRPVYKIGVARLN